MVNRDIPFPKVFVIGNDGEKLGVMPTRAAIEKAKEQGFDLVIISPNPKQPVAKILDYGKFKYERKKKRKEAKANQVVTNNREVRLTPMIGDHDLKVKAKKAKEFILAGDRVKVSLKFRGREMARQELGHETLKRFFAEVEDVAMITKQPQLNSRFLDMYIQRDNKKKPKEAE
ncbi:MAG: translation initiation factor IF-3 [Mycoplasmatales bacterium]|uniref:translation initiation factor IF-3 n=1 Tax=Mycoplasma todarodis TaxID=1937191 RepID=UPI003B50EAF0|nr:translation initiation factor IF-3 [Mycoplasmatales bacterium]